jgi:fumarate reductase subunit C
MTASTPRLDAMKPPHPGPTRTAPPRPPDGFPAQGRYRAYIAFGLGGFFLFTVACQVLRSVWALARGEAAWNALMKSFENPLYVAFHFVALVWLTWFVLRLFRLFPRTQPFRIAGFQRPPDAVLVGGLTGAFALVSLVVLAVLWGAF